jgi:VWFA-related protein
MLSIRLYLTRVAVPILAALCLLAPARAQDPRARPPEPSPPAQDQGAHTQNDEEVVRISTELVQTDVMVFDKSGKFVDGLKPEQFELRVDGKPQQVSFFERVKAGTVDEDAQIAAARGTGGGPAGGAALPLDRGRTVMFFVDDLHLSAGSVANIRKTLLRFIEEEIGQNDEAAVISASGQVGFLQQLTDNKAVLRAAIARINTRPYNTRDGQNPLMTEVHASAIERNDNNVLDYFVDYILRENPMMKREMAESIVQSRARMILQQSNSIALNTLYTLESVVRGFGPLPGRKILFFISDGFLVDDSNTTLRDRMRLIADAAARAGVVIYSLDAQGLRTGMDDASSAGNFDPAGRLAQANMSEISTMQTPLFTLADSTGGRALVNTNALGRVVSGALKETALYYLLAWKPDGVSGGGAPKYQRIEVSVRGRTDLHVIVRRGFFSAPPPDAPPSRADANKKKKADKRSEAVGAERQLPAGERELLAALRSPIARAALPTSMAVGFVHSAKTGAVLTVSVELDRNALTFQQGQTRHADFDLLGAVVDDRGKTISRFGQKLSVSPNPSVPESQQHVVYSFQVPLMTPGLYQVRAAARDEPSGRTGSVMQWVEVPTLKQNQLSLSSIFIGERTSGERDGEIKPEEIPKSVLLSVGRHFARTSKIRFLMFVYNAAAAPPAQPDVALQVQIFRDDQPVFTAPLSKLRADGVEDASRIPYMAELALGTFPAGRYVLQITAIDRNGKSSASQRTNFVIE